jgi:hypothetical protein
VTGEFVPWKCSAAVAVAVAVIVVVTVAGAGLAAQDVINIANNVISEINTIPLILMNFMGNSFSLFSNRFAAPILQ